MKHCRSVAGRFSSLKQFRRKRAHVDETRSRLTGAKERHVNGRNRGLYDEFRGKTMFALRTLGGEIIGIVSESLQNVTQCERLTALGANRFGLEILVPERRGELEPKSELFFLNGNPLFVGKSQSVSKPLFELHFRLEALAESHAHGYLLPFAWG